MYVDYRHIVEAEDLFLLPVSLTLGLLLHLYLRGRGAPALLGLGGSCLLFYLALVSTVAVPFSAQRSAKDLGLLLAQEPAAEVGAYGHYPTSAVFYGGKRIIKLLPEQDVAGFVPKKASWTSKNVMPYGILGQNHCGLVVMQHKDIKSFNHYANKNWQMTETRGRWVIVTNGTGRV